MVDLAPSPTPRDDAEGKPRPLDDPFSGIVFKVQSNMDRSHRDRIAYLRVCSGRFERGMVVTHARTHKPFATKYAHSVFGQERETIEVAWPGDVVGLVNATDVRVGDTLYLDQHVAYPEIPSFAPEQFAVVRVRDTAKAKQFRTRRRPARRGGRGPGAARPRAGATRRPSSPRSGPMQFEVAVHRLETEFGAPVELSPTSYTVARVTDAESTPTLRGMRGVSVLERADGTRLALFESRFWLERVAAEQPELRLDPLVGNELGG